MTIPNACTAPNPFSSFLLLTHASSFPSDCAWLQANSELPAALRVRVSGAGAARSDVHRAAAAGAVTPLRVPRPRAGLATHGLERAGAA